MDFSPLWISFKVAASATVITFVLGIAAARWVTSMKRGRGLADGILSLPMVLPPTVVGFFLLLIFGGNGILGKFLESAGLAVVFTWQGAVVAAAAVSFPIMYRSTVILSARQGLWECLRERYFSILHFPWQAPE